MRPRILFVLIGLLIGALGYRLAAPKPDLSTPKATVQSFIEAISKRDSKAMAACVEGGTAREEALSLLFTKDAPDVFKIQDIVTEMEGDTAKVAVEFSIELKDGREGRPASTISMVDIIKMKKSGDEWRILADEKITDPEDPRLYTHILRFCAALVGQDDSVAEALEKARRTAQSVSCLSNGKQIGTALMMYAQDYDELLPRKKAPYKELIFPYVKNEEVFRCAQDLEGPISYRFNPRLEGVSVEAIKHPVKTVMLYEGKGEKPEYRHDGKAVIVFADGHAKLMTEEEVKGVYWYANGATPAKPTPKPVKPKKRTR